VLRNKEIYASEPNGEQTAKIIAEQLHNNDDIIMDVAKDLAIDVGSDKDPFEQRRDRAMDAVQALLREIHKDKNISGGTEVSPAAETIDSGELDDDYDDGDYGDD
jgi:hypothetical protein